MQLQVNRKNIPRFPKLAPTRSRPSRKQCESTNNNNNHYTNNNNKQQPNRQQ